MNKAKARIGYGSGRIIVDDCPFCHKTHYHNLPIGEGQRMADCFEGEYILDFDSESDEQLLEDENEDYMSMAHEEDDLDEPLDLEDSDWIGDMGAN